MDNTNNNFNLDEVKLNSLTNMPGNSINYLNNLAINPIVLFILLTVIILYFILFSSLNKENSDKEKGGNGFLEALLWGLFILLLLLNGASYFLNTNIFATIKNLFSNEPELNISLQDSSIGSGPVNPNAPESELVFENPIQKEVYHISGNNYSYNQAKAVCKAFDADLANYQQIEDAYEKGANWCSYGWSADQLALFPTNMKIWKKLQKEGSNPNACGRPGINGGYIANSNVKFGANCYGNKPFITNQEKHLMKTSSLIPETRKDKEFNNLVNFYKNHLKEKLVAPFNKENWNEELF